MVQLWSTILCMLEFCSSLFIGHSTIHMLSSSICRLAAAMLLLCLLCCWRAAAVLLLCCWRAAAMLLLCCWCAAAMLLLCCCRVAAMLVVWCCYAAATLPLAAAVLLSLRSALSGLLYSTMPFRFELFNCSSPFFPTIQRELLDQSIFLCVAEWNTEYWFYNILRLYMFLHMPSTLCFICSLMVFYIFCGVSSFSL